MKQSIKSLLSYSFALLTLSAACTYRATGYSDPSTPKQGEDGEDGEPKSKKAKVVASATQKKSSISPEELAAMNATATAAATTTAAPPPSEPQAIDGVGVYKLGSLYDDLKGLPTFSDTPEFNDGDKTASRVMTQIFGKAAIQRLFFRQKKLVGVNVIFVDPAVTEEVAKTMVQERWGAPVMRNIEGRQTATWEGTVGLIAVQIVDGTRVQISLRSKQ